MAVEAPRPAVPVRGGAHATVETLAELELASVPRYIWDGYTLPVPIERIADSHFGLHVREAVDLARAPGAPAVPPMHALSGLLLPDSGQIWVSSTESAHSPGRRRFTISHEIGHWCLHRDGSAPIFCRAAAVDPPAGPERPRRAAAESEADAFAAALLMPRYLVRHQFAKLGSSPNGLATMCNLFGTSSAAMNRRLRTIEGAAHQA